MKLLLCKLNGVDICGIGLMVRAIGAGLSVAPVLTGIALGIYGVLVLGKLLKGLVDTIQARNRR